jgi:hypothetical protein
VIEHPQGGGAALLAGVDGVRKVGGVGAQQIVEDVSARNVLDEEVRAGQVEQQRRPPRPL